MPELPTITKAEWQVMEVVWEKHPISALEVVDHLAPSTTWSVQTVKTLLSRLAKKGVLSYTKSGKAYLYRPAISKERYVRSETQSFLERVFGGTEAPALAQFVRHVELSSQEMEELRKLLRRQEDQE